MINKEERKYIKEAIRLANLLKNKENISIDHLLNILKLADEQIKKLNLPVVGISKRETINNFLEIANKVVENTVGYDNNKTYTNLDSLPQYIVDNYEIKKK